MLLHHLNKVLDVAAFVEACELGHYGLPRHRYRPGLDHPLHPTLVSVDARSTRGIGDCIIESHLCRREELRPNRKRHRVSLRLAAHRTCLSTSTSRMPQLDLSADERR